MESRLIRTDEIRLACLDKAMVSDPKVTLTTEALVARAAKFEKYVETGETESP